MSNNTPSFGRQLQQARSVADLLELERQQVKQNRFEMVDALLGKLLVQSVQGKQIIYASSTQEPSLTMCDVSREEKTFIEQTFAVTQQQSHGVWFLPEAASLKVGLAHFPYHFQTNPRFVGNAVEDERYKVSLRPSPTALFVWAVLEPCFEVLFQPLLVRGQQTGKKSKEEQFKIWAEINELYGALNIDIPQALAVMRYGGGWHKLNSQEQVAAKQHFLRALSQHIDPSTGARYRAYCLQKLVTHYYKKAKHGQAKKNQVITKSFERTLVGFFEGDWLAFLDYIGEDPHPDEQIIATLAPTRVQVGGKQRAAEVAAQMGLPTSEVERMMASYWQQADSVSPVEQRSQIIERYWDIFDQIHAQQNKGMQPLWGLVEDGRAFNFYDDWTPYRLGIYQQLLPKELLQEIEQLWGTVMLPQWPDHVVSEGFPHHLFAETVGPALKFWHGCALTAWFLCEGPYSRTDMAGLATYHRRELETLNEMGTPIPPRLFEELAKAETQLPLPQPLTQSSQRLTGVQSISVTVTTSFGQRRDGFDRLRDIITRYRRQWAATYLQQYLRVRWETEIREAGQSYNLFMNAKEKAPTAKQFAKLAATATNHWFGGDLSKLYGAIQEKSPIEPKKNLLMPQDRRAFAYTIFSLLSEPFAQQKAYYAQQRDYQTRNQEIDRLRQCSDLGTLSLRFVQLEEIYGRKPDMKEFGANKFTQNASVLHNDINVAWDLYTQAIETAKRKQVKQVPPPQKHYSPHTGEKTLSQAPSPIATQQQSKQKRSWLDRLLNR